MSNESFCSCRRDLTPRYLLKQGKCATVTLRRYSVSYAVSSRSSSRILLTSEQKMVRAVGFEPTCFRLRYDAQFRRLIRYTRRLTNLLENENLRMGMMSLKAPQSCVKCFSKQCQIRVLGNHVVMASECVSVFW
jgi:hypothetical protein